MLKWLGFAVCAARSAASIRKAYSNNFRSVPTPAIMHLEPTYACTCRCVYCRVGKGKHKKKDAELSYAEMINLIDQARAIGVKMIAVSGGEPLARKDVLKAMRYAKARGIITSVVHNGTLINKNNVHAVLSSFDAISISLDSLCANKNLSLIHI